MGEPERMEEPGLLKSEAFIHVTNVLADINDQNRVSQQSNQRSQDGMSLDDEASRK